MRHPAVIVLNALLNGHEVQLDNGSRLLCSEDNNVGTPYGDGVVITGFELNNFIKLCEKQNPNTIALVAMELAVSKEKNRRNEKPVVEIDTSTFGDLPP